MATILGFPHFDSRRVFLCVMSTFYSLVPRLSITANAVKSLVKLLRRMTSGGCLETWHFRELHARRISHASRRPQVYTSHTQPCSQTTFCGLGMSHTLISSYRLSAKPLNVQQSRVTLVPRPSITANAVKGLVKFLRRMTSGRIKMNGRTVGILQLSVILRCSLLRGVH